ncbi:hypothetical protein [Coraliomargarita parva]|uniref:hypothetical protein n=1 Tax=Coraliomargarita parva TaxID=3014050 RepID=UPI0022B2FC1D|nr:hypothetical protein [Coraliomargarita parva]
MVIKRRGIRFIVIGLLLVLRIHGEESSAPVQFRLIALGNVVEMLYEVDGHAEKIYASPGGFSRYYDAPERRKLLFYREETAPPEIGGLVKVPLANVTLPGGSGPFLIVLKPVQNEAAPYYQHAVFDASLDVHRNGYFRIFNFSKRKMAVQLARKNMVLASAQSELVQYPEESKAWLKVAVSNQKDDGWMRVSSSPRAISENTRITIFLVDIPPSEQDPNPLGVAVREFRERIYENESGLHVR